MRAYSACAKATLEYVSYTKKDVWTELRLQFSYDYLGVVISLLQQYGGEVIQQEDGLLATLHIRINA